MSTRRTATDEDDPVLPSVDTGSVEGLSDYALRVEARDYLIRHSLLWVVTDDMGLDACACALCGNDVEVNRLDGRPVTKESDARRCLEIVAAVNLKENSRSTVERKTAP